MITGIILGLVAGTVFGSTITHYVKKGLSKTKEVVDEINSVSGK